MEASSSHSWPPEACSTSTQDSSSKPRKKPTVTPRSFKRFFAPRETLSSRKKVNATRRPPLNDISASGANRASVNGKRQLEEDEDGDSCCRSDAAHYGKSSLSQSPKAHTKWKPSKRIKEEASGTESSEEADAFDEAESALKYRVRSRPQFPKPLTRSAVRQPLGLLLRRELAFPARPSARTKLECSHGWQSEVISFLSTPEDLYECKNVIASSTAHALPFCAAACNTNSLVAVGDEEGGVRLLETREDGKRKFRHSYLDLRPHTNAILDLHFSADDLLLLTASGDQTAQIIDMPTQKAISVLGGHVSSVKQVRIQPGSNDKIIATSGRDGSIQTWDLRCKGTHRPVMNVKGSGDESCQVTTYTLEDQLFYAARSSLIPDAHVDVENGSKSLQQPTRVAGENRVPWRSRPLRNEVSITAMSYLSAFNPHLLLSGSESCATVKLWDLRASARQGRPSPLSTTQQPEFHNRHRQFGLTSMDLSGDGARLFTLCKDNTAYAYSVPHLILGSSPEMESSTVRARRYPVKRQGLRPIYGLRHPNLKVSSFYVKLAARPARDGNKELLAVGSTDCCAVLFDESCLGRRLASHYGSSERPHSLPTEVSPFVQGVASTNALGPDLQESIPIYGQGTALIRGHEKEVAGVTWSSGGDLVTVGDDMRCRVWKEDEVKAREVRRSGESNGKRWLHGWAELGEDGEHWDDSE